MEALKTLGLDFLEQLESIFESGTGTFEFIDTSSGHGSSKIKKLFQLGSDFSLKKLISVPDNFGTDNGFGYWYYGSCRIIS